MSPVLNQPSSNDLVGGLRVLPVAVEDVDALALDLAVVGDADGDARQGRPDRADLEVGGQVDSERCGRLGEAVALEDAHAQAAVEVAEAEAQRRGPGDGVLHAAAQRGADLRQHQPVVQRELQGQPQRHPAGVERLGVGDRDIRRLAEDLAAARRPRRSAPTSCRPSRTRAGPPAGRSDGTTAWPAPASTCRAGGPPSRPRRRTSRR